MYKVTLAILLLVGFLSCSQNKISKQKQEILALKEMSDLATAEYNITKIVKANDNQTWYKIGDRKILLSCSGTIKAGIDLSALTDKTIEINNKNIHLTLPPAKIINVNIPPEKIKLEYQQVGLLRDRFSYGEQNELMIQAEKQIRAAADSIGILQNAEKNATLFISNFLQRLGYKDISINYSFTTK